MDDDPRAHRGRRAGACRRSSSRRAARPSPGTLLLGYFAPGKGIIAHVLPPGPRFGSRSAGLTWQPELELDGAQVVEVRTANAVGLLSAEMSRAFFVPWHQHQAGQLPHLRQRPAGDNTFHTLVKTLAQLTR